MPVVVTGASGLVGRHAVSAFARVSPEVRALVRRKEAAEALRGPRVKIAVAWLGDVDNLAIVMAGAHTVCHLVGGLDSVDLEEDILGTLRPVVAAARKAEVKRFLYLSYPGASPSARNPYLRFKGLAERVVKDSGMEFAIIRSTHVYGPGGRWLEAMAKQARGRRSMVIGTGRQVLAAVFVEDVAQVLAAADDREPLDPGVWGLEGPDRVTADGLADLLAGRRIPKLHVPPRFVAPLARLAGPRVTRAMAEILAADSLADAPDAAAEFGVERTSLREGLARSLPGGQGVSAPE
jgi:uncharacterized protein YbjT (DUF2867 family)